MDNVMAIIVLAVIVGIAVLWKKLSDAFWGKMNTKVFNRSNYRDQEELTGRDWTFHTNAPASDVLKASAHIPMESLVVLGQDAGTVMLASNGFHLHLSGTAMLADRAAGKYNFTARVRRTGDHDIAFRFLQWKTADGVSEDVGDMKKLKAWIADLASADVQQLAAMCQA